MTEEPTIFNETFDSMVVKKVKKKLRKCLKCRHEFVSASFANRTCGSCAAQNQRASFIANTKPFNLKDS